MKSALLTITMACLLAAVPATAESSLDDEMSVINKNLRVLGRTPPPPDEAAALVDKCVEAAKKAREMIPAILKDKPEEEKQAALADFRKRMDEVIAGLGTLREAVAKGDKEATDAALKALNEMKKSGHDIFMEE